MKKVRPAQGGCCPHPPAFHAADGTIDGEAEMSDPGPDDTARTGDEAGAAVHAMPRPAERPTTAFYHRIPVFDGFARLMEPELYMPLPAGWLIGTTDVVDSSGAIAAGQYKRVNLAGASVIGALSNALGNEDFPFVFGGDGASFAVAPDDAAAARQSLSETAAWSAEDLGLTLRAALVPVDDIRAAGSDVRVARFASSPNLAYAMFSGGGLRWAEAALKRGLYAVPPAPPGSKPDLSGMSCRFDPIKSRRGVIVSLLVMPDPRADMPTFRRLIEAILALPDPSKDEAGNPVPEGGPNYSLPPEAIELEALAVRRPSLPVWLYRLKVAVLGGLLKSVFRHGVHVGSFDPKRYINELVANSDFRKFDDGLRLTMDCTAEFADRLEALLAKAAADHMVLYGLHRQNTALITCFVPNVTRHDHVHFIDGAEGGYAEAARSLKAMAARIATAGA